jgi:hypothetical protein
LTEDASRDQKYVTFPIDSLSPLNHFLRFSVIPVFVGNSSLFVTNISVQTDLTNENHDVSFIAHQLNSVVFDFSKNSNQSVSLFSHHIGIHTCFTVRVAFKALELHRLIGCHGEWQVGDYSFTVLESGYRVLFALIVGISLLLFVCKLKGTPFKLWHLEQKLTHLLMILGFGMNNPLHLFFVQSSFPFLLVIESICGSVFVVFLKYLSLVLFDSLRFKNRKIGECFFTPKLVFFGFFFMADCLESFIRFTKFQRLGIVRESLLDQIVVLLSAVFEGIFVGWLLLAVVRSWREMDVTESYKFRLYAVVCLFCIGLLFVIELVQQFSTVSERSCLPFIASITLQNLFIVLMTLFHWPYELMSDQYLETDEFARDTALIESD